MKLWLHWDSANKIQTCTTLHTLHTPPRVYPSWCNCPRPGPQTCQVAAWVWGPWFKFCNQYGISVFSTVLGLSFFVFAEAAWDKCPKPYHCIKNFHGLKKQEQLCECSEPKWDKLVLCFWRLSTEQNASNATVQTFLRLHKPPKFCIKRANLFSKESCNMLQPKSSTSPSTTSKFSGLFFSSTNISPNRWSFLEQMLLHPSCKVLGKGSSITPLMGVSFSWNGRFWTLWTFINGFWCNQIGSWIGWNVKKCQEIIHPLYILHMVCHHFRTYLKQHENTMRPTAVYTQELLVAYRRIAVCPPPLHQYLQSPCLISQQVTVKANYSYSINHSPIWNSLIDVDWLIIWIIWGGSFW